MYNMSEKNVSDILRLGFKSLVGKSCKRLEILAIEENVSEKDKILIAKKLIKELSYESMRDVRNALDKYSEGTKIQVSLTKPGR